MLVFNINKLYWAKQAKEGRRITHEEFAREAGVAKRNIPDWLDGTRYPNAESIDRLLKYFDCEVSDLIEHVKEEPDRIR